MSTTVTAGPGTAAPLSTDLPAGQRGEGWRRFRRNRGALVGLAIICVTVFAAIAAPLITAYDPEAINTAASRQGPSAAHWFGTDVLGRDLYTRVVYGARISLWVGLLSTAVALAIGLAAGAVAGYYGGIYDAVLMRLTDMFLAFPYLLLAIAIITVIRRGLLPVIAVLGLLGWMHIARIFRGSILQAKQNEYVEAARAIGCSDWRIIMRHIVPNAIQPVIVYATLFIGSAILSEAALSFLGVGLTEPTPAWGLMVASGRNYLYTAPHILFAPGLALFGVVLAFILIGDGLRDAIDPRLR